MKDGRNMLSIKDFKRCRISFFVALVLAVFGLFSAYCATAAAEPPVIDKAFDKTAEQSVDTPTERSAEQDVPNTAESKQKHLYLVRNAILYSSRYKQYSEKDKNNVRILLDGLETMAVRFHKPVEVRNRLLDAFEDYSCVVVEILRCRKDIETMLLKGSPYFFLNWDSGPKDTVQSKALADKVARFTSLSLDEKRMAIKGFSVVGLYRNLVHSRDELHYLCSENSVDVLSNSLCSQNKVKGSKESTFDSFQRLEKLMDKNFSMPIMDDDPEEFH